MIKMIQIVGALVGVSGLRLERANRKSENAKLDRGSTNLRHRGGAGRARTHTLRPCPAPSRGLHAVCTVAGETVGEILDTRIDGLACNNDVQPEQG